MKRTTTRRLVLGAMTGTSVDGVDAAAVEVSGKGLAIRGRLLGVASGELGELGQRLRSAQRQVPLSAGEFAALSRDIALAHLGPLRELVAAHGKPDLIVLHGQTLYHAPPLSLQLIDPTIVAHAFSCSVASNLRGADLAASGQGAPITPLADWLLFRSARTSRVLLNLGGFANATLVPSRPSDTRGLAAHAARVAWVDSVRGLDICLCNQLLDHLAMTLLGRRFDEDGAASRQGKVSAPALERILDALGAQSRSGRSLGTTDEVVGVCAEMLKGLKPGDALATATRAIAQTITTTLRTQVSRSVAADTPSSIQLLLAGGGAKNLALADELRTSWGGPVATTGDLGIPVDARESVAMALLGCAAWDGSAITLPAVTHRSDSSIADGCFVRLRAPTFTQSSHSQPERPFTHQR